MNARYSWAARLACVLLACVTVLPSCTHTEPAKRYPIKGQILAVHADRLEVTLKHEDIPGFMMAMTMTYPVARKDLMNGRAPGELVEGTLEVDNSTGRLVELRHTGSAPLPSGSNEAALADGILSEGDIVPDAAFVDQDGRPRTFASWKGTATAVTFIYTRCPLPNFCPLMEHEFAQVQEKIAADPSLSGKIKLVAITFDPEYDTPAVLRDQAQRYKADPHVWTFLTGDRATIDTFAAKFGVSIVRDGAAAGQVTHTLSTAVVGPEGRLRKLYLGGDTWTPSTLFSDLRAALGPR